MIDLMLALAEAGDEGELARGLVAEEAAVRASAGRGDRRMVGGVEAVVRGDPAGAFVFDGEGRATLAAGGRSWRAGRFEAVSIAALRERVAAGGGRGGIRLWAIEGAGAATDIGALQARAGAGTLFQVASQFNCLEAPGPAVVRVASYLQDSTQGPRASISALPGTLLRHYRAPDGRGGRFVQTHDGPQVELLAEVCGQGLARVRNGYLTADQIRDPAAFVAALERGFETIRVGVHHDVEVVLGHDWAGAVEGGPRQIGQVFTSTLAADSYGPLTGDLLGVCRLLLRAAYLGTLLAAAARADRRVVLTLIGGGVFGNPGPLIWDSLVWAVDQAAPLVPQALDVVVNGRDLSSRVDRAAVVAAVRARGGGLLVWPASGPPALHR